MDTPYKVGTIIAFVLILVFFVLPTAFNAIADKLEDRRYARHYEQITGEPYKPDNPE